MCVVPINFRLLRLPTASFQIDLIFTMQWQYCGNNWSEDDWCNICAVFERCTGNYKLLLMDFVAFGCGLVDEIDKLMGSYLMTKEDPSVILDPVWEFGPRMVPIVPRHQWMVDDDCNGFKFAPPKLYHPYHANKKNIIHRHGIGVIFVIWATNPTPVDVPKPLLIFLLPWLIMFAIIMTGTTIDSHPLIWTWKSLRIRGKLSIPPHATYRLVQSLVRSLVIRQRQNIAKRQIDFMTGNVNSYVQILNGSSQLESITMYNNLAASLSEYHTEV